MRISDWSSDVCSSDLSKQVAQALDARLAPGQRQCGMQGAAGEDVAVAGPVDQLDALAVGGELDQVLADDVAGPQARVVRRGAGFFRRRTQRQRGAGGRIEQIGRASCRESVCQYD